MVLVVSPHRARLVLDLRTQLAREIGPWRMAGLALTLVSGFLIFAGGAVAYFEGQWFRRKMALLPSPKSLRSFRPTLRIRGVCVWAI